MGAEARPDGVGDAHCHLTALRDPAAALEEARRAGVGPVLAVAMTPGDAGRARALRLRHPDLVRAGVGLHPSRVPELGEAELDSELALVEQGAPEADFLGEVGLDYRDAAEPVQRARQRAALERLLDIAARHRLPANLHTRRADRELLEAAAAFTRRTGLAAVLHWFTHSRKLARRCADAGLYISAGPSILWDPRQAEVARQVDPDLLLVETDSPVEYGGEAAAPWWAARVADRLAELRGEARGVLAERLGRNLQRFLGGPSPPASRI